jgi:adenylylsulfate kinase-like enzyme
MKYKGVWFYGLAGSGKTTASRFLKKKIKQSIVIDGDDVRKLISFDLKYTKKDRIIQINRLLGMGKICIKNNYYPIISSVYFDKKTQKKCEAFKILPIQIINNNKKLLKRRKIYKKNKNVVGKDIKLPLLKTKKIVNENNKLFFSNLKKEVIYAK